ncbi:MAG: 3-dehydroquinate synthase [Candidatus Omnitrophica bacterium]|nr:3-dehydroquinate synthase [Candidatus Omnitrophota bacterium]MCM8803110.1 3-dehydroquinate synthase [Candidatus Omnitrophota bacterium]
MEKIKVNLYKNSYFIYLNYSLEKIGTKIRNENIGNKVVVLSDENIYPVYGKVVKESVERIGKKVNVIIIRPGEKEKNFKTVINIIKDLVNLNINRDDLILNLGGGVISDIGGFVASIYMRGIKYVNVPTTLLAQVDASIGGKTGINMEKGKNLVGSFYQPYFVYIDFNTLLSLPYHEIKQGISEIIKYGVIKNKKIFEKVEDTDPKQIKNDYEFLIGESIKIKVSVVEKDEKEEKGLREILNFGHTLGHGIEISDVRKFSHGDAVFLGMIGESYISYKIGIGEKEIYKRIKDLGEKFKLLNSFDKIDFDKIIEFLKHDKKVKKGRLRFVLPERIGKVRIGVEVDENEVLKILKEMKNNGKN